MHHPPQSQTATLEGRSTIGWSRLAGSLATLSILAAPLAAQGAQNQASGATLIQQESYEVELPSGLASGAFTTGTVAKTVVGSHPDAFVLRGGSLIWAPQAGLYDSFSVVDVSVLDVTTVPGAGQQPGADAIAYVGPGGVRIADIDPSDGLLDALKVDFTNTTGIQVRSADVDGDGLVDLVVLDGNGQTFTVYSNTGSGWSSSGSFNLPGVSVVDFDLARLDATAGHELVVGLTDGSQAYSLSWPGPTPALLQSRRATGFTENQVETIAGHVDGSTDGFVWVSRIASLGRWSVSDVTAAGFQSFTLLDPGDEVVGVTTGQLDNPTTGEDLVISLLEAERLYGFINQGTSGFTYGDGAFTSETFWSGDNTAAYPILGDLDGSGIADLLIGNEAENGLEVIYDFDLTAYDPSEAMVSANSSWSWTPGSAQTGWDFLDDDDGSGFGQVEAVILSTDGVNGMSSTLWMDPTETDGSGNPVQNAPFLGESVAHCDQVIAVANGGDEYSTTQLLPLPNISNSPALVPGHHYVLELQPQSLGGTPPPPLRMGLGLYDGLNGVSLGDSGILVSPNLTPRRGFVESQLGYFYTGGFADGADVIVEIVPIRRLKPPPGPPPPRTPTPCTQP